MLLRGGWGWGIFIIHTHPQLIEFLGCDGVGTVENHRRRALALRGAHGRDLRVKTPKEEAKLVEYVGLGRPQRLVQHPEEETFSRVPFDSQGRAEVLCEFVEHVGFGFVLILVGSIVQQNVFQQLKVHDGRILSMARRDRGKAREANR